MPELGVAATGSTKRAREPAPAAAAAKEDRIAWLRKADCLAGRDGRLRRDARRSAQPGLPDDRVYVFTPKGDVVDLPAGSTPLDFLPITIHSDARPSLHRRQNWRPHRAVHPPLQMGDQIEIIAQKQPKRAVTG
ncbi:TGS domain-containing protein [Klebsiella pneumoniae subsp. pneumoniae]|nr:TGS domain-containing protein [Klebsiella pneumoniae subsp. pneumoniae]